MNKKGNLILLPCPIVEGKIESLSSEAIQSLHDTTYFIVEKAKTARHFIKAARHPVSIAELVIHEMTGNTSEDEVFLSNLLKGTDIGVISEAGCPGVADPGSSWVDWAHRHGVTVRPLIGPSSILLALMASGFSGQNFAFNGYLSNKKPVLIKNLKTLENIVKKSGQTQIFMEVPYRNAFMLETIVQTLEDNTKLCVACDINAPTESIIQQPVRYWKSQKWDHYHKRPCIFIIG
ncbi:MAG: SAM-dependent methyltransferase [Saprospiraceae bacterium]